MIPSDRIGLSQAALREAILAELEESGSEPDGIARAVAEAMDANNREILRQLRDLVGPLAGAGSAVDAGVDEDLD